MLCLFTFVNAYLLLTSISADRGDLNCIQAQCSCCRSGKCEESVGSESYCSGCIDGFTGPRCEEECPASCFNCSQMFPEGVKICDKCSPGFYNGVDKDIKGQPIHQDCSLRCAENCELCTSYKNCTRCKPDHYTTDSGPCAQCPANCKVCVSNKGCTVCDDKFFSTRTNCNPCSINCLNCTSLSKCTLCDIGYFLQDGGCLECLEGCITCNGMFKCRECKKGFFLVGGICRVCQGSCEECALNEKERFVCEKCKDESFLYNDICRECPSRCRRCKSEHLCESCYNMYTLFNGSCYQCSEPCIACQSDNSCTNCQSKFYVKNEACNRCPENCASCLNESFCLTCNDGNWGSYCERSCWELCVDKKCEKSYGICSIACTESYRGNKCNCSVNYNCYDNGVLTQCNQGYGENCDQKCREACIGNKCDRITGNCPTGEDTKANNLQVIIGPVIGFVILAVVVFLILKCRQRIRNSVRNSSTSERCSLMQLMSCLRSRSEAAPVHAQVNDDTEADADAMQPLIHYNDPNAVKIGQAQPEMPRVVASRNDENLSSTQESTETTRLLGNTSESDTLELHAAETPDGHDQLIENPILTPNEGNAQIQNAKTFEGPDDKLVSVELPCPPFAQKGDSLPISEATATEIPPNAIKEACSSKDLSVEFQENLFLPTSEATTTRIPLNDIKKACSSRNILAEFQQIRGADSSCQTDARHLFLNAVLLNGYKNTKKYCVSLEPKTKLSYATENNDDGFVFWNKVSETKCSNIVMLTDSKGAEITPYWPKESLVYGSVRVTFRKEIKENNYTLRTFLLEKTNGEHTETDILHWYFRGWLGNGVPENMSVFVDFWESVGAIKTISDGPLWVHCSDDIGRTGVFIAYDILKDQATSEGYVDVYECVKELRMKCPTMFQSVDQYRAVYECICSGKLDETGSF